MKNSILCISILTALLFVSCSSTRITSSWREPDKSVDISHLKKVLVVALLNSESSRHKAEDQMVKYLQGKGVVSYKYLSDSFNENDEEALRTKIKADGFDGAIIMRLLDVEKRNYLYTRFNCHLPTVLPHLSAGIISEVGGIFRRQAAIPRRAPLRSKPMSIPSRKIESSGRV
jgi:hypothetical protein